MWSPRPCEQPRAPFAGTLGRHVLQKTLSYRCPCENSAVAVADVNPMTAAQAPVTVARLTPAMLDDIHELLRDTGNGSGGRGFCVPGVRSHADADGHKQCCCCSDTNGVWRQCVLWHRVLHPVTNCAMPLRWRCNRAMKVIPITNRAV